jgi:hypothetical protein
MITILSWQLPICRRSYSPRQTERAAGQPHGLIVEVPEMKSAGIPAPNTSLDKNSHIVTPAKLAAYNIGGSAKTSTSLNSSGCKSSYSF